GLPCGRWGSIAAQASSDNQNECVIAASLSVRLNEGRDSPKYSTCCMSSQPRPCTHKSRLVSSGWSKSPLPPKADIRQRIEYVCFVPKADIRNGAAAVA